MSCCLSSRSWSWNNLLCSLSLDLLRILKKTFRSTLARNLVIVAHSLQVRSLFALDFLTWVLGRVNVIWRAYYEIFAWGVIVTLSVICIRSVPLVISWINIYHNSLVNALMQILSWGCHDTLMSAHLTMSDHASRYHACHEPTLHGCWHSSRRMLYARCLLGHFVLETWLLHPEFMSFQDLRASRGLVETVRYYFALKLCLLNRRGFYFFLAISLSVSRTSRHSYCTHVVRAANQVLSLFTLLYHCWWDWPIGLLRMVSWSTDEFVHEAFGFYVLICLLPRVTHDVRSLSVKSSWVLFDNLVILRASISIVNGCCVTLILV